MTSRTHTPKDVQKIMEPWRDSASDYERGFIDGMQKQMQSSVDKAVNAMSQRTWVGLTEEERHSAVWTDGEFGDGVLWAEKLLKERNK